MFYKECEVTWEKTYALRYTYEYHPNVIACLWKDKYLILYKKIHVGKPSKERERAKEAHFDKIQDIVNVLRLQKCVELLDQWHPSNDNVYSMVYLVWKLQFITTETMGDNNKCRFFVEIMVAAHADGDREHHLLCSTNAEVIQKLEMNCSVANYRFIEAFTKRVEHHQLDNLLYQSCKTSG